MSLDPALLALLHLRHPGVATAVLATHLREATDSLSVLHGEVASQRVLALASALVEKAAGS